MKKYIQPTTDVLLLHTSAQLMQASVNGLHDDKEAGTGSEENPINFAPRFGSLDYEEEEE